MDNIKALEQKTNQKHAIYDARTLGRPKMLILGLQHMFAMFGATVLVPALTGMSVSATLLFAGIGTLLFHFITKKMVPAFLGSSFAFLGGYAAIAPVLADGSPNTEMLPYACFGVACAGLVYVLMSVVFYLCGAEKVIRFFPPIVTGPVIISIGLTLSSTAINSCMDNWLIAMIAVLIVVICNIWGKGMIKIIPILLGVIGSYTAAVLLGEVDLSAVAAAPWFGSPFYWENTVFSLFIDGQPDSALLITAVFTIVPLALATMVEHIGDICAISSTCGKFFAKNPGFHRTLLGDGLATTLAACFGAPANTTYGENTGVLALSRVYDSVVIRIAACFAILLSFCPKFAMLVTMMPVATMGGVSLVLYGMISAVGVRNIVETNIDFSNSRNVIIAALILVLAIGITYSDAGAISFVVMDTTIQLSGIAVASLTGIILNVLLPEKEYKF